MSHHVRSLTLAGALILAFITPNRAAAQGNPEPLSFKFNTGQGVQPIFEGWAHNPDGTTSMYFGYMNRNYVETPSIPVGPENKIEPGDPDRGQPTLFNTRIRRMAFNIVVPKDWGKKELVWTLTVHGETAKAVGWMQPEWEIDPVYGGKERNAESLKNKPPTLTLESPATATVSTPVTLMATVTDDGLPVPKPRRPPAVGQETPPTLKPDPNQPEVVLNVPQVAGRGRGGPGGAQGLVVNWIVWRGPANAAFTPAVVPVKAKEGKPTVTATFSKPGTYVLRATANDGELHVEKDVTINVRGPQSSQH
jgi:hypothetical protein